MICPFCNHVFALDEKVVNPAQEAAIQSRTAGRKVTIQCPRCCCMVQVGNDWRLAQAVYRMRQSLSASKA